MKQLEYKPLRADGSPIIVTYCPPKVAYSYGFLSGTRTRCPLPIVGPNRRRGDALRAALAIEID